MVKSSYGTDMWHKRKERILKKKSCGSELKSRNSEKWQRSGATISERRKNNGFILSTKCAYQGKSPKRKEKTPPPKVY